MKTVLLLCASLVAAGSARAETYRPRFERIAPAASHVDPGRLGSERALGRHDPGRVHGGGGARHFRHHRESGHFDRYRGTSVRFWSQVHYRPHWSHGYSPRYLMFPAYRHDYYPVYGATAYPYYGHTYSGGAATSGLWLGALAGGIIGHNSGEFRHGAWRGAAWGAGLGWLLGAVADANRRPQVYAPAMPAQPALAAAGTTPGMAAPPPAAVASAPMRAPTPMSQANALFGRN